MLAQLTQRLLSTRTFETAVQTILDDVVALHGAEYGNVQLPLRDELVIVAQRGLSAPFLKAFRRVKADDGCACGRALRLGKPVVVVDVDKDPEYAPFRKDAKSAGYRSVQSTPLMANKRRLVGIVSTLFAQVYEPTAIEMEVLSTYSAIAAEHLRTLIADGTLAERAKQMNEILYRELANGTMPRASSKVR